MALSPNNNQPPAYVPSASAADNVAKRVFPVDTLREMKEEKLLFNKVQYEPDTFFQFGSPGSGAPLRNPNNNQPIAKIGNITENLWRRYADKPDPEAKRREMGRIIDMYAQKNAEGSYYDPVTRSHIKPESYWNDWFGKPGAGAPNIPWNMHKQNLDRMLEPSNKTLNWSKTLANPELKPKSTTPSKDCSCSVYDPYDPNCLKTSTFSKRYRSDHHNRYEIFPQ